MKPVVLALKVNISPAQMVPEVTDTEGPVATSLTADVNEQFDALVTLTV